MLCLRYEVSSTLPPLAYHLIYSHPAMNPTLLPDAGLLLGTLIWQAHASKEFTHSLA